MLPHQKKRGTFYDICCGPFWKSPVVPGRWTNRRMEGNSHKGRGSDVARVLVCMHAESVCLCPTLCNLMGCSPPGSSIHVLFQARILEVLYIKNFGWYINDGAFNLTEFMANVGLVIKNWTCRTQILKPASWPCSCRNLQGVLAHVQLGVQASSASQDAYYFSEQSWRNHNL